MRHFFKVGEARGQARTMLCAVAMQLARMLRGFAAALVQVVDEHGDGSRLGLKDMFERLVL